MDLVGDDRALGCFRGREEQEDDREAEGSEEGIEGTAGHDAELYM